MTTQESTQVIAQSELLSALAEHAITFPSDEEANAAGFYMNDASLGSCGEGLHGVVIYYHDLQGNRLPFHRMRFANPPVNSKTGKANKYKQPLGSRIQAYFPNCVDWPRVTNDVSTPIILIEGEYKAFSASQNLGIPAIGLGGVNSYKESNWSPEPLLDSLMGIDWLDRIVYICFDSDAAENSNVKTAQERLATVFKSKKANPLIVTLPPAENGAKQGLDDFILARGAQLAANHITTHTTVLSEFLVLDRYSREWVQISKNALWGRLASADVYDKNKFFEVTAGDSFTTTIHRGGKSKTVELEAAPLYAKWPGRVVVNSLTTIPGAPRLVKMYDADQPYTAFNMWVDTRPPLHDGDVSGYLALVNHIFKDNDALKATWHDWVATIVQRDVKMHTAWVIYTEQTATGKSMLAKIVGSLFGSKGWLELNDDTFKGEIEKSANAVGRQLVVVDDLGSHRNRHDAALLRNVITADKYLAKIKYIPEYEAEDYRNYIFTTNEHDAVNLTETDRRYLYLHANEERAPTDVYAAAGVFHVDGKQAHNPEARKAAGVLRKWYLNYAITPGYDRTTKPVEDAKRQEAKQSTYSEIQSFVKDLSTGAHEVVGVSVWSSADLAGYYDALSNSRQQTSSNYMTGLLKRVGVEPTARGVNVPFATSRVKTNLYTFGEQSGTCDAKQLLALYVAEAPQREALCNTPVAKHILSTAKF